MVWTQYAVNTVCSGRSGIVVYGGGDIVFGAKMSNQWMQYVVELCKYCIHCLLHLLCTASTASTGFTFFFTKDNVPTTIYHYSTASTVHCPLCTTSIASTGLTFLHQRQCPHHHIPLFHCVYCVLSTVYYIHCIHWFDPFAPKTMSPPPYTTIPLRLLCTVHCVLHPLHPLV